MTSDLSELDAYFFANGPLPSKAAWHNAYHGAPPITIRMSMGQQKATSIADTTKTTKAHGLASPRLARNHIADALPASQGQEHHGLGA